MLSTVITNFKLEVFLVKIMTVLAEMWTKTVCLFTELSHLIFQNQNAVQEIHKNYLTKSDI